MTQLSGDDQKTLPHSLDHGLPSYIFYYYMVMAALNFVLSFTASLGNTLILIALHKESSLHPPSKLLYQCLACTDVCIGVMLQPVHASFLIQLSVERNMLWDDASPLVVFLNAAGVTLCGVSMTTLTAISLDRFLALLLKLRYRHAVNLTRARTVIALMWLSYIVTGILRLWYVFITTYLASIVIALNLIASTFCYIKIYITLHHHRAQVQGQEDLNPAMDYARYRKTVSNELFVHLTLLACYVPFATVTVLRIIGETSPSLQAAEVLAILLVFFNSSLNPVLYCWRIREVRQAAMNTVKELLFRETV